MSAALQLQDVALTYTTRAGNISALAEVSLDVAEGEFVAILGPSGCGKSTLLKLTAGLLHPTHGRIMVGAGTVTRPGRETGVVFQKPNFLPWKTVLANVLMPAKTLGLVDGSARKRAREMLAMVGLGEFADNYPFELSGGMQQRVGIARMLLHDPQLLLMDEPFAALDALTREMLMLELQRIWEQQRKSVLFITHSIQEAVFLADRVLVMSPRPGKIVASLTIPLPRPRTLETLGQGEFMVLCQHLRGYFAHA
ncbi:ABC transporter ATP-binding protein [Pantoea sp. App145]|uniref:ABC transporter ATP-binding protein n=1 Tax=Pantoea sp. App145 TaxID=3071567 RepID=UPI003A7FA899